MIPDILLTLATRRTMLATLIKNMLRLCCYIELKIFNINILNPLHLDTEEYDDESTRYHGKKCHLCGHG